MHLSIFITSTIIIGFYGFEEKLLINGINKTGSNLLFYIYPILPVALEKQYYLDVLNILTKAIIVLQRKMIFVTINSCKVKVLLYKNHNMHVQCTLGISDHRCTCWEWMLYVVIVILMWRIPSSNRKFHCYIKTAWLHSYGAFC